LRARDFASATTSGRASALLFPTAPRLDPLRLDLAKLDPATAAALRRPPAAKGDKQAPTPKGRP
jgi:hypothetical protein